MMAGAEYRRHLFNRLVETNVPEHLHEGLIEYLATRRPMGHFLTAIVSNDLMEACMRAADADTRWHIADIVMFLVNYAPANSWGSPNRVAEWLASTSPAPELFE